MKNFPTLGFGLGLRPEHYNDILEKWPVVDWFEALTENYLEQAGRPWDFLQKIRARYPIALHGVSLSIGSVDPLNSTYLQQLKSLVSAIQPAWVSDHLCWTGCDGINLHDLLPLPYTEACLTHVVQRVQQVQETLGQRILLENVSSYLSFQESEMTEWEFLSAVAEQADCYLLLDINNIFVSATNHGFDPNIYLESIPTERVAQFHLAGHSEGAHCLIDTHDAPVPEPVWALYAKARQRFPKASVLIERDGSIPALSDLLVELQRARGLGATTEAIDHEYT